MEYFVIGADGNKYGPASVQTLQVWIQEGRIGAQSMLEDAATGRQATASTVPGLFPAVAPPVSPVPPAQSYGAYPRQQAGNTPYVQTENTGALAGIIIRSVLAVVSLFIFKFLGLILAAYALIYAVQLKSNGSKYGTVALVIAASSLLIVGLVFFLRMQSGAI